MFGDPGETAYTGTNRLGRALRPGRPASGGGGLLEILAGIGGNPGQQEADVQNILNPLRASYQTNLNDQIGQLNASSPGRFSSANLYQQGQLRERSLTDFNVLEGQVRDRAQSRSQDRQMQAILALLAPVLGPTFGGPFTQGSSGFDNFLGLLGAGSSFLPFPGMGGSRGNASGTPYSSPTTG